MPQLVLPLAQPSTEHRKPPEQRQALERLSQALRQETAEILVIANRLHGQNWPQLSLVPTAALRPAAAEYRRLHQIEIPHPQGGPIRPKPLRPYRPWPLLRKQRERLRRLQERARKQYSIPGMQHQYLQAELCRLPQYFGVCVLPGTAESCALNLRDFLPNRAQQREADLRAAEQKIYSRL